VDAVGDKALVLAAGGIVDGRGLAAALMLGADGAWIGTRFVATSEAAVADEYKQRIVDCDTAGTELTHIFGREHPVFNPIRVLRTSLVTEWNDRVDEIAVGPEHHPKIGEMDLLGQQVPLHRFTNMVPMQGATGSFDELPMLAGEGLGLITDLPSAADVVARMAAEAEEQLKRFGA